MAGLPGGAARARWADSAETMAQAQVPSPATGRREAGVTRYQDSEAES